MTLKDKILSMKTKPFEIEVKGLGKVFIKQMSGRERDSWEFAMGAAASKAEEKKEVFSMENYVATFLSLCLCDENSKLLFTSDEVSKLGEVDAHVLRTIYEFAKTSNKITDDDVEEIRKN